MTSPRPSPMMGTDLTNYDSSEAHATVLSSMFLSSFLIVLFCT